LDRRPCFQCAAMQAALPSGVFGPVDIPPWSRHRVLPAMGCFWQGAPDLVLARQSLVSFSAVSFVLIMALAIAPEMSGCCENFVEAVLGIICPFTSTGP